MSAFENKVLRRIFEPKRDEAIGEWTRLHNEKLNFLYFSLNIVRVTKSSRIRWWAMKQVWGTGEVHTRFWW